MRLLSSCLELYGLVLIAIGMGGIKSCIAAFGLDQLMENDENLSQTHVRKFFSSFNFSIHLGVFFGLFTSPTVTKFLFYGGNKINAYAIRFGLSAAMMSFAISK